MAQYDASAEELRRDRHLAAQTARANKQPIPPLPAAMKQIPVGRNALILAARDQLRMNFGDAEFTRLDAYVRTHTPWKQPDPTAPPRLAAAGKALPDRVYYRSLFHSVTYFQAKAKEERDMGLTQLADGLLTPVQRQAGLSDEQARILDQVTVDYQRAAGDYEKRLQAAGLVYRKLALDMLARDGKITFTPELITAQKTMDAVRKQMDDLADNAIQRLRAAFGEQEFGRLDEFVKRPVKGTPAGTGAEVTR